MKSFKMGSYITSIDRETGERMDFNKIICPHCKEIFCLSTDHIQVMEELNYKYSCPYCGKEHILDYSD